MTRTVTSRFVAAVLLGSALVVGVAQAAASQPVKDMAKIMLSLEHYPSAKDKEVLAKIAGAESNSAQERTIAQAIANLNHAATTGDKAKLKAIMDDAKAAEEVRALARIVHDLDHKASSADEKALQGMLK